MKEAGSAIEKYQPLWGSWRVDELIDQGNGSELYRVYKEEWGKRYISAVKHLSVSIGRNDIKEAQTIGIDATAMPEYFKSLVGSILYEIELMYRLRGNSNIVTYEDHVIYERKGGFGWDILIRMEFLQSLPDFLIEKELGRLDVARLGIDICKALEVCGKEGIIHRNIKDSSIFVSPREEFKLGSFSMAKEHLKGGRIAQARFNPLYMAPELYKEQNYDFSVDIYSLGIVMYKLLNKGRLPFLPLPPENITADDTERSIATRMAGEALVLPADAGDNLGAVILKACSFDKRDRYKSPCEFRQKLERFLKAEVKSAKGDNMVIRGTLDYQTAEANYEKGQIPAEKEEDDVQAEYAEELERIAVVELASSVDKIENDRKLSKRKFIRNVGVCAAMMVLAFAFAFICAYEVEPAKEEPIAEAAAESAQVNPSPVIASTSTPEPATTKIEKTDNQPRTAKKQTEVHNQHKKAVEYYEQHEYEKAIVAFSELIKADAAYSGYEQYADSFVQLAGAHNLAGVQQYNEGKLIQAVEEFDKALNRLEAMRANISNYNQAQYSRLKEVYAGNKVRIQEKADRIDECLELADECNRAGVKLYNEGSFDKAKQEIDNALRHMREIRLLVPKYSSDGYDGLMQIYEENLKRIEAKL